MTDYPKLCERCGIFVTFVSEAGRKRGEYCYPCYMTELGKHDQASGWLEFWRDSGREEDVEKWYETYRQNNKVQQSAG